MIPMFDEMLQTGVNPLTPSDARPHYADYARWLAAQPPQLMRERREQAELIFRRVGITFAVYGDKDSGEGNERLMPMAKVVPVAPSAPISAPAAPGAKQ